MKYAILALGLLVTPATAETYTRIDCSFIEIMLDNCTIKPDCKPLSRSGGGESKAYGQLTDEHPKFDPDKFNALCQQVCDGKSTTLDALYKYCPWRRNDLIRDDRPGAIPNRERPKS
jgi:hypothetical protein